jgi:paraquat-inducible protein A
MTSAKTAKAITARDAGFVSCHFCSTLSKVPKGTNLKKSELICPCCKSTIHSRKPNSINRTWALLIAAIILYIPANTLPIMTFTLWGDGQPDTIISGVIHLMDGGMWPLALLIFVASIFIPVLKLIILMLLMISVQTKARWKPQDRTALYRVTEFVGRWSMVDVFVIGILVSLVQFGNSANVTPGLGSLSFAAVVILTMFAARAFDPRLIWDVLETETNVDNTANTKTALSNEDDKQMVKP